MKCPLCKGEMLAGKTVLPFGSGENFLVVKDVPALGGVKNVGSHLWKSGQLEL